MSSFTHEAVLNVCREQARQRGHIGDDVKGFQLDLDENSDGYVIVRLQSGKSFEFSIEKLRESEDILEAKRLLGDG